MSASMVRAQDSGAFVRSLAEPDTLHSAVVNVTEHGRAADIMRQYNEEKVSEQTIAGYRIRIFFSNNQNARHDALAVQEKFRGQFPDISTYVVYETPSFLVTVGNCLNVDEALILLGKVRKRYPSAFMVRSDIPITEFLRNGDGSEEPEAEPESDIFAG